MMTHCTSHRMTGLFVDGVREEFLDEPSDRYAKLRESSHQYVINQFGLSCFAQDKAGGGWVAKTFNLYVFPEPLSKDVNSKKFLCDAGSLSFLAGNGFDFTKWITKGIPFMPAKERKEKIEAALKTYEIKGKKADREPVLPYDKAYIDFLTSFTLQLQFFINSSDDKTLLTDEMNGFKRLLAFQEIEKLKLGATVFVKKIETSNGYARLELTKGSPEEVKAMQDDDVAHQISRINSASAFTRVLEVMRESGKPAVGHNCNFDVAYLMAIVEKKLPQKWEDYKALVQHWFPGGVYDTKHIARGIPEVFNGWTGESCHIIPIMIELD
jgi:poly(A)-specific ribonuclease